MNPFTRRVIPASPWFRIEVHRGVKTITSLNESAKNAENEILQHLQEAGFETTKLDECCYVSYPHTPTVNFSDSYPEQIAQWLESEGCIVDRFADEKPVKSLMCRFWL